MIVLDNIWNALSVKYKDIKIGKGTRIHGRLFLHGRRGGIVIGDGCTIISDERVNPTSGVMHTHLAVGESGKLIIGKNVGMSHVCITAFEEVVIEDNVLIGSGAKIWDTDFHSIDYNERVVHNTEGTTRKVRVCEGAFIGACAIVLKGVTVGRHSVIGAGSVVTCDVPDCEVWAGNPAHCIRKLSD